VKTRSSQREPPKKPPTQAKTKMKIEEQQKENESRKRNLAAYRDPCQDSRARRKNMIREPRPNKNLAKIEIGSEK
jgi:hypothetical protein